MNEGDKNSRFFHTKASNRRRRNRITMLQNEEEEWLEGPRLDGVIVDYFQALFLASGELGPMEFLSKLGTKITGQMHEELSRDYTVVEIKLALKQMHPSKALGLDGLPPLFYQKY